MVKKPDSYLIEDSIERAKRWIEEEQERRNLSLTVDEQKKLIAEKDKTITEKDEKITKQQPFVNFAKTVIKSDDCIDMNSMAKLLFKETGIKIGRNRLFEILRNNKILMSNNEPYQRYINDGTFKLREISYTDGYDNQRITTKTMVTGKGQVKLCRFIEKYQEKFGNEVEK